jgi:hypothetical protein
MPDLSPARPVVSVAAVPGIEATVTLSCNNEAPRYVFVALLGALSQLGTGARINLT